MGPLADDPEGRWTSWVVIVYGSGQGLSAPRSQLWAESDFGGAVTDNFGDALATGDFDGDGFTDLAVGISSGLDSTEFVAGQVRVIYGSRAGLAPQRSQLWDQDSPGIADRTEDGDQFGSALVAANFGKGPQDDLAIGASGEDGWRGAVHVVYGSRGGLTATGSQLWSQASPGVPGEIGDRGGSLLGEFFGASLAADNFSGRAFADLAIGVPGDRAGGIDGAGAVNVIRGSAAGLSAVGAQLWTQKGAGVKGRAETDDHFGLSLAAGHFSGKATADLAIGVPGENESAGAVNVLNGSSKGLTARRGRLLSQNTKGLPGRAEASDFFGSTLAAAHLGRDASKRAYDDLAVGAPGESIGGVDYAGIVHVVFGSSTGLVPKRSQTVHLNTPGIVGAVDYGDSFGSSLAAGNFDGARGGAYDGLVVGAPPKASGSVSVVYGAKSGLTTARDQRWTPSALGHSEIELSFGSRVAAR